MCMFLVIKYINLSNQNVLIHLTLACMFLYAIFDIISLTIKKYKLSNKINVSLEQANEEQFEEIVDELIDMDDDKDEMDEENL